MSLVEPIAIVGIGCRLPGGVRNPDGLWNLMANGVDAITEVPKERWHLRTMYHPDPWKPGRMYSRWGGFVDHVDRFDAQFFGITPREAAPADPQQRLLLEVAYEAVEDAGLTLASLAGTRTGVYVGITTYDYGSLQINERVLIDAYSSLGSTLCVAANRISYFFNLLGPSLAVDTACSSSLVATHLGCRSIWNGETEMAFVAGVNLMLRPESTIACSKASMLSPDGRCKSFDSRANGFVRGEGAAVVILKPLGRALADRDQIYALIRATAVNQDGRTEGITVPSRVSQEANLRDALRLADIAPESVQYVEAHGPGTPVGDPIEAAALGEVYGKAQRPQARCVIGSIKSNMGHLEAAAGIAGLIKTALCLRHRQIPANLHFEKPNPQIPFEDLRLCIAQRLQPWPETYGQPPRAGVNSFGFGGTNGHAILEAPPEPDSAARALDESADSRAWVLLVSARSAAALADLARSYMSSLGDGRGLRHAALRDICYSAATKRSHHEFRLTLVAHDKTELVEQLDAFLRGEDRANTSSSRKSGEASRPVFVCSGMGQQWWAMGRELLTQEPVYRRAIEEVSDLHDRLAGWSLLDKLTADEKDSQIQQTHIAQPAIFAMQVALAALWRSWGIEPAAVLGHSAGEVAASYIAGALSLEDAVRVIFHRSRLLRRTVGQGTMLAAGISRAEAARLVERHPGAISIAAINAPGSVTLSGDAGVLAEIDKALNEAGLFSRTLQVEAPFHSPKMEQLQTELVECLRDIRPRPASTPFFSTVTGTALVGSEVDGPHWYRNTRQTVLFQDTMAEIIKAGHRVFLEIGAHPILRHDIAACLNERSVQGTCLCSVRRGERERAAMLGSLGRLHTIGAEIDWHKLFPSGATAVKLPSYPFEAESHWWREPDRVRRARLGLSVHPLLGERHQGPQPSWNVELDTADLRYLEDHRIGNSMVFPGAGIVEMALAAAREIFGAGPCVLEDIEFQKILVIDEKQASSIQLVLDTDSSEFSICACADASDNSWDRHARGFVRQGSQPPPDGFDLAQIRQRCPDPINPDEFYRMFSEMGVEYGPTFRGVNNIWQGEREALAEIRAPGGVSEHSSDYRLHPAVLDACFHSALAALPIRTILHDGNRELYVPVKIDRLRFHATPSTCLFANSRLKEFGLREMKADIRIFDEAGNRVADVEGMIFRPSGHRVQRVFRAHYEYQWKLSARAAAGGARDSHHLPSPEVLAPIVQEEGDLLWRRFDRARFQDEFHSLSRATAAAYIVRALRELGWTPACAAVPIEKLADRLGLAPQYLRWLRLMLKELTADEMASTEEPHRLWKALWNRFPEWVELMLLRRCGEKLPDVLRGRIDPLNLIFPEGALTAAEVLFQDSIVFRLSNLLAQKAVVEIVSRFPRGKALRILEIGGGTGGTTSFLLPALPEYCCEYVFTDISPRFIAHVQHKFAQYSSVQYRTLDIERDPLEQGFKAHSFDLIVATDVLHATQNLRMTLERVKQLLGSCGTLMLLELTRPWLSTTFTFGLLKGWWLFDDDVRRDQPCVSQRQWKSLLCEAGFSAPMCVADCPDADRAQRSLILARGPQLSASPPLAPQGLGESRLWLLFADEGAAGRPSTGAELALQLRARGDRVIEVTHGSDFLRFDGSRFTIRAGNLDDMRRLMDGVGGEASRLAGVIHLWSLDTETTDSMTKETLMSSARLGCVGVLHLVQTLAATNGLAIDGLWLVTHAAQPLENRVNTLEVAQSPLWGLGRVTANEYRNLRCQLVDLATCSREEIESLAEELISGDETEDEIALHGELRYVRRLVPVSPATVQGMGRHTWATAQPFCIELRWPGILDSLSARPLTRVAPKPKEVEIEVTATSLNFRDLMLAMGMLPEDAIKDTGGPLLGQECAGRVVAVGDEVSELAVGDEVVAKGHGLATHITVDHRFAARKPGHLSFEQAATIPIAFLTAFYSLHTLGRMQRGERVLIHAAAGGVGLAAVQLALQAGAVVFATAGSPEKRELLSALGVPHVMDSRSLAFADDVMKLTDGEGVDLVLNSLAGEAIDKSLSILRPMGRFIEIGLIDIYNNRKTGMRSFRKNISLFAVELYVAFEHQPDLPHALLPEVLGRFASNVLGPLPQRVFPVARVADALRYMAQAKHVGKLVVSMKETEGLQVERGPQLVALEAEASYLITGGLGGFGLAVAERLARRGARHLALVGRSAPSASAQAAVGLLRQRGVEVMIVPADIAVREQARRVVTAARTMGPLRGIVHAAMVLDDAPIERLTEERMWKAMAPKIMGAWNLHALTGDMPLDFFVLFSSFACTIGNPGQANYVAGNAFLNALAYHRRERGLPALAVEWGVVGGVGHVAESPETVQRLDRLGHKAIPVSEMLDVLDELLCSSGVQVAVAQIEWKDLFGPAGLRTPARIAGLVGETGTEEGLSTASSRVRDILDADEAALPMLLETYIRDHLARTMGASPVRIDSQQSLANLGLDSLMAVEMRNRINADLGVNIPLAKFSQSASVSVLAVYLAERLRDGDRRERSKIANRGIVAEARPDIALSGKDAADLLERIDELSDEEVKQHLSVVAAQ